MSHVVSASGLALSLPDFARKRPFRDAPRVDILKGVDFSLDPGQALAVVGESGSGKTSLGRVLLRLLEPSAGRLLFEGRDITYAPEAVLRPLRARMQIIFQDPMSSLNPRRRIGDIVAQPLRAFGRVESRRAAWIEAGRLLETVGLNPAFVSRYPHELSGGQRQRVGIARAIAPRPALVVADEVTSGLDVSAQARIVALLRDLIAELNLALVFISHDLSLVRTLCQEVLVLRQGEVVERGPVADIFAAPRHDYTRALLDSVPLPVPDKAWLAG